MPSVPPANIGLTHQPFQAFFSLLSSQFIIQKEAGPSATLLRRTAAADSHESNRDAGHAPVLHALTTTPFLFQRVQVSIQDPLKPSHLDAGEGADQTTVCYNKKSPEGFAFRAFW